MLIVAICFAASASAFVVPASVPRSCAAATRASCPSMDETILEKALAGELEEEGAENVFLSEVGWATYLDKNAGSSYNMNQRPSLAEDGYFTPDVFSNPVEGACVLRWLSMVAMAASVHCWLLVGAGWRWLMPGACACIICTAASVGHLLDVSLTRAVSCATCVSRRRSPLAVAVLSSWLDSMKGVLSDPLAAGFPTISNDPSGARSYPKGSDEVSARTIKPKDKMLGKKLDKSKRIVGIPGFNAFGTPSSKQGF